MENIKWLWGVMDKRYHKWHILGLIISAVTSLMLLINPYLTMRLMDDVIVAQNPEPLVGLLLTMLIVKVTREGLRYLMVVLLEHSSQNTLMNLRMRLFTRLQYQDMRFFDIHRYTASRYIWVRRNEASTKHISLFLSLSFPYW